MKKLLFLLAIMITLSAKSQTVITDLDGNYIAVRKAVGKQFTKQPFKRTNKTFTDINGNIYPVYQSNTGKLYIIRTSKKTGKDYKQYI